MNGPGSPKLPNGIDPLIGEPFLTDADCWGCAQEVIREVQTLRGRGFVPADHEAAEKVIKGFRRRLRLSDGLPLAAVQREFCLDGPRLIFFIWVVLAQYGCVNARDFYAPILCAAGPSLREIHRLERLVLRRGWLAFWESFTCRYYVARPVMRLLTDGGGPITGSEMADMLLEIRELPTKEDEGRNTVGQPKYP